MINFLNENKFIRKNEPFKVKVIICLCDPVKRLRSAFLHVKAEHLKARPFNRAKFGENATIYPFKNFDFQDFVEVFVKNEDKLKRESAISNMILKGKYQLNYLYPFKERNIS